MEKLSLEFIGVQFGIDLGGFGDHFVQSNILNLQSEKIDEEEDRPGQKNSWRRQIKSKKQLEKTDQVKKTVGEDRPSQTNQLKKSTRQCISPSTYTGGRSPPL